MASQAGRRGEAPGRRRSSRDEGRGYQPDDLLDLADKNGINVNGITGVVDTPAGGANGYPDDDRAAAISALRTDQMIAAHTFNVDGGMDEPMMGAPLRSQIVREIMPTAKLGQAYGERGDQHRVLRSLAD